MRIHIVANDKGNPIGQLATAELHFDGPSLGEGTRSGPIPSGAAVIGEYSDDDHPLAGLKLIGFGVWQRRDGGRNVTFPARSYSVNGERRSFALLRPIADAGAQNRIRDLILEAYATFEKTNGAETAEVPAGWSTV